MGLAAAIPAVMAYNYFVRRIRVVDTETAAFASDYLNIIRRHLLVE
jgi:biopolymer transport protein TolQ